MSDAQGRRLTYEELGQLIGRTPNGARMFFASRRGWPKRTTNRIGERASVLVPAELAEAPPRAMHDAERKSDAPLANGTDARAIARAAIDALTEQLAITNRHLDDERTRSARAIERATVAEQRADRAEEEAVALQAELVEVRVAERGTSERATATAAEITELRRLLDVADRRIQGERTRAEQERELRTQALGRLADKDATITGLVAEKQVLKQEVETLTELARARRSWWGRVFGR